MKSVDTFPLEELFSLDRIMYRLHAIAPSVWHSSAQTFFRFSAPFGGQSPMFQLQTIPHPHKTYWRDRNGIIESAGIGVADSIEATQNLSINAALRIIHERTHAAPDHVRYYGGMRFRHDTLPDKYWSAFGVARFILPLVEMIRENGKYHCHCTIALPHGSSAEDARTALQGKLHQLFSDAKHHSDEVSRSFHIQKRSDAPDKNDWTSIINKALYAFAHNDLEKVVLARRVTLECSAQPDVMRLLQHRANAAQHSTVFLFAFDEQTAFLGATPEYLYKREGRTIATEAIAGTRKRGAIEREDAEIEQELLFSDKDRREHASVQRYVASGLDDLTESFDIGKVEVLKLATLQHLYAPFTGKLRTDADDAAIIERLHPTPAVGGQPRRESLDFLAQENFDRGWYAAPVGWANAHAAEFVVAIRSALITGTLAHLFSGAGIVNGSNADAEWNEIEMKIAPMLDLFSPKAL